jgi:molecular chaperone DnaK
VPQIEVTFDIDSNGIINVSAKDMGTGKQQAISIKASTGLSDSEIERMKEEAKKFEEEDKKKAEKVEILTKAETMSYTVEKTIKKWATKWMMKQRRNWKKRLQSLKQ